MNIEKIYKKINKYKHIDDDNLLKNGVDFIKENVFDKIDEETNKYLEKIKSLNLDIVFFSIESKLNTFEYVNINDKRLHKKPMLVYLNDYAYLEEHEINQLVFTDILNPYNSFPSSLDDEVFIELVQKGKVIRMTSSIDKIKFRDVNKKNLEDCFELKYMKIPKYFRNISFNPAEEIKNLTVRELING